MPSIQLNNLKTTIFLNIRSWFASYSFLSYGHLGSGVPGNQGYSELIRNSISNNQSWKDLNNSDKLWRHLDIVIKNLWSPSYEVGPYACSKKIIRDTQFLMAIVNATWKIMIESWNSLISWICIHGNILGTYIEFVSDLGRISWCSANSFFWK